MPESLLAPDRGYRLDGQGLTFTRDLTLEQWTAVGRRLVKLHDATPWAIGDWLVYGRGEYGETYERAAELSGRSFESLSQYLRVAVAFPVASRIGGVSWSQHRESLRVPVGERAALLQQSKRGEWTKRQLLQYISSAVDRVTLSAIASPERATVSQRKTSRWRQQVRKTLIRCPHCGKTFRARGGGEEAEDRRMIG
jgi:hypothetical protein